MSRYLPRLPVPAIALLVVFVGTIMGACGGTVGPSNTQTAPLPASIAVLGTTTGVVGDQPLLSAVVTFTDLTTRTVTAQATWTSTSTSVATVNQTGVVTMVAPGECDLKVTYTEQSTGSSVTTTVHVVVSQRPAGSFALSGTVTDGATGRGISNVFISATTGANTGNFTSTDASGFYTLRGNVPGTFMLHYQKDGYDPVDVEVTLRGDTQRNVQMRVAGSSSGGPFVGTYAVKLNTTTDTCSDITPATTGTVALSGSASNLTIDITERGITRTYHGSIDANGAFSGSGSGITNIIEQHNFTGGVSGTVANSTINGTEGLTLTLGCPNGTATIVTTFSGSKQ